MNILETQNISKFFGDHVALDDVSLAIPENLIYGLLGPNGAGKTTLIRIITKIYASDRGKVFFKGAELKPSDVFKIGYLPEERGLYKKMKVGEQLLYLAQLKGLSKNDALTKIKYWLEKFDMLTWWNKKVEELSKGMQQKVQFVAAVLHQPELIILDEPFSGFDPVNVNLIKDEILKLREEGSTIIFSTHRMESVEELCDHIALINKARKILDGEKHQIKEAHKQHIFEIEHQGSLERVNGHLKIISSNNTYDNWYITRIQADETFNGNKLLKQLIDGMEIRSFKELLPTMNEIFINKIQEGHNE